MTHSQKPSRSSGATEFSDKNIPEKPAQGRPNTIDDIGQEIDRPGFDLGGASGDTHAGTGLGLGEDASDTPGDRRLPGRRLDNKLTIPRWDGSESDGTAKPAKKQSDVDPQ